MRSSSTSMRHGYADMPRNDDVSPARTSVGMPRRVKQVAPHLGDKLVRGGYQRNPFQDAIASTLTDPIPANAPDSLSVNSSHTDTCIGDHSILYIMPPDAISSVTSSLPS